MMKTKIITIMAMVLVLGFAGMANATIVDVSATTNKPVYLLGEEIVVFVITYNPNPEPVTLGFASALQASYLVDGVFDWTEGKVFADVVTYVTIEAYSSHTWNLSHGSKEMAIYPLSVGTHTIVGEVVGYGQSAPVEFEVVPEPATLLLLGLGGLLLRKRK